MLFMPHGGINHLKKLKLNSETDSKIDEYSFVNLVTCGKVAKQMKL